ncbi:response regulator transcription factor [Aquisalibacillus elongatus]|uniref:AraC family two component transcriptional regulator n=1 Tax=Aquisalibacillus elongatus TaxID=485577 RepID=A0A3N5BWA3_9BACI|nr:helix-turn-helix domain-containing protein [Aquisalibacillus elongatus]RPF54018.1 AraC family two component transcriptional regulator [Aquisalibacillus elongatus]
MKFLLAESDELEIKGLHWLITANQIPHNEIVEVRTSAEFERAVRANDFDMIILNIDLFNQDEWAKAKHSLRYSKGQIIVHSAHQTFQVAHEALEVGAKHLFIQPITPNEWSAKVRKVVREAGANAKPSQNQDTLQESAIFYGLFGYDFDLTRIQEELLENKDEPSSFVVSVLEIDAVSNQNHGSDRLLHMIKEELQEYSPYIIPNENMIVLIFNLSNFTQHATLTDVEQVFIRLLRLFKERQDISITVGLGNDYHHIHRLRDSYLEAKTSIQRKFYFGVNQVYRFDQPFDLHGIDPILTPDERSQLIHFLEDHDRQGIKEFLFNLFLVEYNQIDQFPHPDYIRIKLTSVMANIRRHMLNNTEMKTLEKQYQLMFNEILNGEELSVIVQKLVYFCYALFNSAGSLNNDMYSKVTQMVVNYIEENYHERRSLSDIALAVNKSKFYISHLFKQETGQTISEYLQKVRTDQAKQLLKDTDKSIQEVGYQVGFDDQSYFSRIFKKWEGQTPNQFKNNIIKKEQ